MVSGYVGTCGLGCLSLSDDDEEEAAKEGTTVSAAIKSGFTFATVRQFWTLGLPGGAQLLFDISCHL